MEGRDLSSSTAAASTNRDGSSSATDADDAVFSVTVALAKDAALHFQSAKFAECVEVLNQLLHKKSDDPKVILFPLCMDTELLIQQNRFSLSFLVSLLLVLLLMLDAHFCNLLLLSL